MAEEAKTVTLVDKDGNKFNASHPAEINTLVFGHGYRFADKNMNPDKAVALLAEKGAAAVAAAELAPAPVETPK